MKKIVVLFSLLSYFLFAQDIEKSHSKRHFVIAIDPDYMPFTLRGQNGKAEGMFIDLWRLWAKENNYTVTFRFYDWLKSLEAVRSGEADFHSGTTPDYDWMYSSDPIYEIRSAMFAKSDQTILDIRDLYGKTVGVIDPYYGDMVRTLCQGKCKIRLFVTYEEMVRSALDGEIVAMMDDVDAMTYYFIRHQLLSRFKEIEAITFGSRSNLVAAVTNKDNAHLVEVINRGLARLSPEKLIEIEKKWLPTKQYGYYHARFFGKSDDQQEGYWVLLFSALAVLSVFGYYMYRLRKMRQKAEHEALIDPLTGVYNKRAFERIEKAPVEFFVIMFVDVDNFKAYNDFYGHAKGDELLATVARICQSADHPELRVYRVGGDEFVLIAHGMDFEEAKSLCQEIVRKVRSAQIEHIKNKGGIATISVGGAWSPRHADLRGELYRCADTALYEVKRQGRDGCLLVQYEKNNCLSHRNQSKDSTHKKGSTQT